MEKFTPGFNPTSPKDQLVNKPESVKLTEYVFEVTTLLEEAKPEQFSPGWLYTNDQSLYRKLRLFLPRNEKNVIDWQPFVDSLSSEWQEKWQIKKEPEKKILPVENYTPKIIALLEEIKPEQLSPTWLARNDLATYQKLVEILPRKIETRQIDWQPFVDGLPLEWQEKWHRTKEPEKISFEDGISRIVTLLEKLEPERFSPKWLQQNDLVAYKAILDFLPKKEYDNTIVDYQFFVERLPKKWQEKWFKTKDLGKNFSPEQSVSRTVDLLAKTKPEPENIGPSWIYYNDKPLYQMLLGILPRKEEGKMDWQSFVEKLPKELQEKWEERTFEYLTIEDCVSRVSKILEESKPDQFGPTWIRENDVNAHYKLKLLLPRDEKGQINWESFVQQLPKEWQEKWSRRESLSLEECVSRTSSLLDKLKPEQFNPTWLKIHDESVYLKLASSLPRAAKRIEWQSFIKKLPREYQVKWVQSGVKKEVEIEDSEEYGTIITRAVTLIEKQKPESFGPKWIYNNSAYIYNTLVSLLPRTENGRVDWHYFFERLPKEWQEKWEKTKDRKNISVAALSSEVMSLIEKIETKPEIITPKWISDNNKSLYQTLIKTLPRNERNVINWQPFVDALPEAWQEKWEKREMRSLSFKDCISITTSLLEKLKPKKISPGWLLKNDPSMYNRLSQTLPKKAGNKIDWQAFVGELPKEWQEKWTYIDREFYKYIEKYSNEQEVIDTLAPYEDKLYTVPLYAQSKKDDREIADKIVSELSKLAIKGNDNARLMLEKDLKFVCGDWMEKYPELRKYQIALEKLDSVIQRCIYQNKQKGNFFGYLFSSLMLTQSSIPNIQELKDWTRKKKGEDDEE